MPLSLGGPVERSERIQSIDVLRGVAVLGILVMNIQSFAMIGAAYLNPTAYGDLSGANYRVWLLSHVLADQKFMSIFSMLFGAGIVLMTMRREEAGLKTGSVHYRRMGLLLLFGLLHAYLLWYGDILYHYAMCGFLAYLFRRCRPVTLVVLGVLVTAVGSLSSFGAGMSLPHWPPEAVQELLESWAPDDEAIAEELAAYRGGWATQMSHRAPAAFLFQTLHLIVVVVWRAGGLMLAGMGLVKLKVFSASRSYLFYVALIIAAGAIGIPTIAYGIRGNFASDWDVHYSFFLGGQYNYWGSILVALGWIGLVMLVCKLDRLTRFTSPLAAVGRMALTNYLMQTLICTTIFYGHGLGWFGRVERIGQITVVFGVWIVLLVASPIWLHHFHFGPAEWLWRSLTYMQAQPMRRSA